MFKPNTYSGIDYYGYASSFTNTNAYTYFWNVGVKYNMDLKKYPCSGGGAASGGSVVGVICLLFCGGGVYYLFNKKKG